MKYPRRLLKKANIITHPTLATISPARPESAKTASSPRDAPSPKRGRRRVETGGVPSGAHGATKKEHHVCARRRDVRRQGPR